jgi:hypothetical protein
VIYVCFTGSRVNNSGDIYFSFIAKYLFYSVLSVLLYGLETLLVTLREEDRLRLSEKRVLRSKFIRNRETEGW